MALTAVPTYKGTGKIPVATRQKIATGLFGAPAPVKKPPATQPGAGLGTSVLPGASKGGLLGSADLTTGLPQVQTDYQTQISQILKGLGLGNSGLNQYVPPTEYQGEITADPEYQLGESNLTNTKNTLAQGTANAFRQGFIGGGFNPGTFRQALAADPSLAQFSQYIDQSAIDAAGANQMSTKAQLDRALSDRQAALPYELAARGMVGSGEAGQRASGYQRSYDEQTSNALTTLLGALRGTAGDYQQGLIDAANQWEKTKSAVALRLAQTKGYSQPTGPDYDYTDLINALNNGHTVENNPAANPPVDALLKTFVSQPVQQYANYQGTSPYNITGGPTMGFAAPAAKRPAVVPKPAPRPVPVIPQSVRNKLVRAGF